MTEHLLSQWPAAQNDLFVLFLLLFLSNALLMGHNRYPIVHTLQQLFLRHSGSIHSEPSHREGNIKLILCLQAVVLAAILLYCFLSRTLGIPFDTVDRMARLMCGTALLLSAFFLYKLILYFWVGYTFFPKENTRLWISQYTALIALSGILLFPLAVVVFYWPEAYFICLILVIIYFLSIKLLMLYKICLIFFPQKSDFLYFILYLCAQELIPLFFISKIVLYFYST
jgi:hypothetical protein